MNRRDFLKSSALAAGATRIGRAQVAKSGICQPVLKRGYDNSNTGANLGETVFTQANVAAQGIRQVFTLPMEGDRVGCEAQPLIAPSVAVDDGTTRDLCIVATMNGLVYAFDANDSDIIWVKKLSVPVNGSNAIDAYSINDHWSVISTPVIDAATNRLYAVAWTDPNGNASTAYYQMHVLNLKDGSRVCAPVTIEGTSNGQVWNKMMRKQRSSLLMTNVNGVKTVFFGCGTVQETSQGAAGWVIAFDVATNTVSASLAMSSGEGSGIWQGGSSLCADAQGYLYAVTGNGGWDAVTDFGEAVVKMQYTGSAIKVVAAWSPWSDAQREGEAVPMAAMAKSAKLAGVNASTEPAAPRPVNMMTTNPYSGWTDDDLGSGGPTIVSNHLIVSGKSGVAYVLDLARFPNTGATGLSNPAANYAKLSSPPIWYTFYPGNGIPAAPANATALDTLYAGKTHHMHSASVSYNSAINGVTVFCWGENGALRAWKFANGSLTYLAQSNEYASANVPTGMPGGFMTISANGSVPGTALLWALIPLADANKSVTNGRLLVYDPEHFVNGTIKVLWDSFDWNITFLFPKFNVPIVSGGKLFVPTYQDELLVFGLA